MEMGGQLYPGGKGVWRACRVPESVWIRCRTFYLLFPTIEKRFNDVQPVVYLLYRLSYPAPQFHNEPRTCIECSSEAVNANQLSYRIKVTEVSFRNPSQLQNKFLF